MRNTLFFRLAMLLLLAAMPLLHGFITPNEGETLFFTEVYRFQSADGKPYIEISTSLDGSLSHFSPTPNGTFQSFAALRTRIRRIEGKDSIVVHEDERCLASLPVRDTVKGREAMIFVDFRRLEVLPGVYEITIIASDTAHTQRNSQMSMQMLEVPATPATEFAFSDAVMLHKVVKTATPTAFSKNGWDFIPALSGRSFYDADTLKFYAEMYHSTALQQPNGFVVQAQLRQGNTPIPNCATTLAKMPKVLDIFSGRFPIEKLATGTYYVDLQAIAYNGQVLAQASTAVFVNNSRAVAPPSVAADDPALAFLAGATEAKITYHINTLRYISTDVEQSYVQQLTDITQKKNYLLGFWQKRLSGEKTIEQLYNGHNNAIEYANKQFKASMREGWETDRGRILLKYGIPNNVERFPSETGLVPYETWRYDHLKAQNSVIFVFADLDMATGTYPLIHSNKYGEQANPLWRRELARNRNAIDGDDSSSEYNSRNSGNTSGGGLDTKLNPLD